jgi:hypothetical protein
MTQKLHCQLFKWKKHAIRNLHTNVYTCIYNNPRLGEWISQLPHPYSGLPLNSERTTDSHNRVSLTCIELNERNQTQKAIYYVSFSVTTLLRQNQRKKKGSLVARDWELGRVDYKWIGEFSEAIELFCILILVITYLYTFIKTHRSKKKKAHRTVQ